MRIGPTHFSISDPNAVHLILGHDTSNLRKSQFYDAFVSGKPSVFSTRDKAEHLRKRRRFARSFSADAIRGYLPILNSHLNDFVQRLEDHIEDAPIKEVDLLELLNFFAFDVLSDLAFGESLGMLASVGLIAG